MSRTKRRLRKAMLIYALAFAVLLAGGLYVLHAYLSAFEASRPIHVAESYRDSITKELLADLAKGTLERMNPEVSPREESLSRLEEIVREAELGRSRGGQDDGVETYVLQYEGTALGKLVLRPVGRDRFGFAEYEVTPEDFDFSALCSESRVTIPETWSVRCNGVLLGDDAVVEREIRFELLAEFYESGITLPYLQTYSTGLTLTEPELEILDEQGRPVASFNEDVFADNCLPEEREAATELADRFLREYVAFSSNADNSANYHFNRLKTMVVPGGDLEKRLAAAVDGLKYARSTSDELLERNFEHVMALGEGTYLCDMSYVIRTEGSVSTVTNTYHMKLILTDCGEEGLRVMLLESC